MGRVISAGRGFFSHDGERVVASQPYRLEPCARLYLYGYAAYGAGYVKHRMPKMPLYVKRGVGVPKQGSSLPPLKIGVLSVPHTQKDTTA